VGARTPEQLGDSLSAAGWTLPIDIRTRLDKVSTNPFRYPRAGEERMAKRRDEAVRAPARPK
jgi:hypothetical protein